VCRPPQARPALTISPGPAVKARDASLGNDLVLTIEQLPSVSTLHLRIRLTGTSNERRAWINELAAVGETTERERDAEIWLRIVDEHVREIRRTCFINHGIGSKAAQFVSLGRANSVAIDYELDEFCYDLEPGEVLYVQASYASLAASPDPPPGGHAPINPIEANDWTKVTVPPGWYMGWQAP
jgi:hypothetical protein